MECLEDCVSYHSLNTFLRPLNTGVSILSVIHKVSQGIFGPWLFIALWGNIMRRCLEILGADLQLTLYAVTTPIHEIRLSLLAWRGRRAVENRQRSRVEAPAHAKGWMSLNWLSMTSVRKPCTYIVRLFIAGVYSESTCQKSSVTRSIS